MNGPFTSTGPPAYELTTHELKRMQSVIRQTLPESTNLESI